MSVEGDFTPSPLCVAIVGAREALPATVWITKRLAEIVVRAGGVVVSGGANGTDAAAHLGAIEAGGRTWCVLGCGAPYLTPSGRKLDDPERFTRILDNGGAIVRPFPEKTKALPAHFLSRNRVIMALSQVVVIAQAAKRSGTMNAARHAKELGKEIWVVPGVGEAFAGTWELVDEGYRLMRSDEEFAKRLVTPKLEGDALIVFDTLANRPKHPDEIAAETGLSTPAVTTALLTLALGDVVVEGSAGLYQRK